MSYLGSHGEGFQEAVTSECSTDTANRPGSLPCLPLTGCVRAPRAVLLLPGQSPPASGGAITPGRSGALQQVGRSGWEGGSLFPLAEGAPQGGTGPAHLSRKQFRVQPWASSHLGSSPHHLPAVRSGVSGFMALASASSPVEWDLSVYPIGTLWGLAGAVLRAIPGTQLPLHKCCPPPFCPL